MKLSDVMSAMKLASYAEIGLVLFLIAFLLVSLDLWRSKQPELEHIRNLPLDDEQPTRNQGDRRS